MHYNGNYQSGVFRSKFEEYIMNTLEAEGISFSYEPIVIKLFPSTDYSGTSYERIGKKFKKAGKVRGITYKPDFVGVNWIMEAKGIKTPEFQIKWKLFKQLLNDLKAPYTLFLPSTTRDVKDSIKIIKELKDDSRGILSVPSNQQLALDFGNKPKIDEIEISWQD